MRRISTAPAAANDLRQVRKWLLQPGSGASGRLRWNALRQFRRMLQRHPYIGSASQDHPGCREILVSEHRIIYQIRPDTGDAETAGEVDILRVFGPGQLGLQL